MLPINADRLRSEVDQILQIISSIKVRLDAGVPGDEIPANDMAQEIFQVQLRHELMLASQRLLAISEVLE